MAFLFCGLCKYNTFLCKSTILTSLFSLSTPSISSVRKLCHVQLSLKLNKEFIYKLSWIHSQINLCCHCERITFKSIF